MKVYDRYQPEIQQLTRMQPTSSPHPPLCVIIQNAAGFLSPPEHLAAAATPTLGINIYLRLVPGGKLQVVMCEGKVEHEQHTL